jgi:hypothetical protein
MRYMTFNSSCSYAGVANMLEYHGILVTDRQIALDMDLPFLFSDEGGVYAAGPMLQSAKWFELYLKPLGFYMTERVLLPEEVGPYLESIPCGMLGILVGSHRHAVVSMGKEWGKYRFLNNRHENSKEPDYWLLDGEELLSRLKGTVTVATLEKGRPQAVDKMPFFLESVEVLRRMKGEIHIFCDGLQEPQAIKEAMDKLFRAILLDGVTMLELLGEKEICKDLKMVQGELLTAVREGGTMVLKDRIDLEVLEDAIGRYMDLIPTKQ